MTGDAHFIDQFIDDYFSETDEHLATVRRVLLEIESASTRAADGGLLQELLRALHTLKGLSGMVGLTAAEEVAHAMEDGVRALPRDRGAPPDLLELLFTGEAVLEASVEARRSGVAPASPGPYVDRMRDVLYAGSTALANVARDPASASQSALAARGRAVCSFEFTPSAELMSRGVGVDVVRQRLASLGDITATTPRVRQGGGVVFEFDVALRAGMTPDDAWRDDGVSWQLRRDADEPGSVGLVVHSVQPTPAPGYTAPIASNVVRVDLTRLDDLMRMVGGLVVARARLSEQLVQASETGSSAAWENLHETSEAIERQVRSIREGVMRVRLVAVSEVFERMRFAMRDVARETEKAIRLEFSGQETEIDKLVVDRMLEPLLHLVRNAASHGIETRAERISAGKDPEGTICLRARAAGDRMIIEVQDDGAGMDGQRIARRATALGLVTSGETLGPDALLDIICSPGFSTRDTADMTSGRGVGMAVVRSTIRGLGGELLVDSVVGQGTRFTIELPLTLMITDALILEVGDQPMAIPQIALREILPLDPAAVTQLEKNEVMSYRGRVIPLVNVGAVFKLRPSDNARRHVLIVGSDAHAAGLVVDRVVGLREIVVHPVSDPMIAVPGISGATELADGRVSLILDAAALVRDARERGANGRGQRLVTGSSNTTSNGLPPTGGAERTWS